MRKTFACLLILALLLTGCASNADTQPSPSVGMTTPMTSPNVTNMPSATNNMDGVLGSDAQQLTTADAVAIGNMALVGVTYDSSYQGELDDRIRGMVLDRAKAVNPAIQSVAVTDDPTAFSEIASLYQMLQSGSPYTTVKTNADTLADGMSLYKG